MKEHESRDIMDSEHVPAIAPLRSGTRPPEPLAGTGGGSPVTGCGGSEPFALRVLGDSMEPEFSDGVVVIAETSATLENGCFVIAELDGGMVLRQLVIDGDRWRLRALNERYPNRDIDGVSAIRGRVIQRAGRRRRDRRSYL